MTVPITGRGPQLVGVYSTFLVLTTIFTALRVYVRAVIVRSLGWDDYLAAVGWVFMACFISFAITGATHGTGQHIVNLPVTEFPQALKFWWLCEPFYVLTNMAIKGSIGLMLLRLVVEKSHRMIIWIVLGVTEFYSAVFFFIFTFQCQPSSFFWTRYQGDIHGFCLNTNVVVNSFYAYSAVVCVGDWVFAILPYFLVRHLQMNRRTKAVVAVILAMGSIASTATIIRFPYLHYLKDEKDFLYTTMDVALWSITETGLGIIASSAATLKPLFKDILGSKFGGSSMRMTPQDGGYSAKQSKPSKNTYLRSHSPNRSMDTGHDSRTQITKTYEVNVSRVDNES